MEYLTFYLLPIEGMGCKIWGGMPSVLHNSSTYNTSMATLGFEILLYDFSCKCFENSNFEVQMKQIKTWS
jgi:hypothetical protein